MAVTLEEAKKNVQDDLQMGVIDEFQKSNWILEHIPFDDAVSPTGGGSTPSYSYTRLKTQPTAQFREINKEYTPSEVTKERHTVEIKVFGGSYEIDRVIASMGGIVSEVELQQAQKITPSCIKGNNKLISKIRACARRASMYQVTKDNWGNQVESYGSIPFVDMKTKPGTNDEVVGIDNDAGTTSLYVARLAVDGLHAVSFAGVAPVQTWLPDFSTAGAVKKGEVEMNAAIALKASKAAGVYRSIGISTVLWRSRGNR